MSYLPPVSRSLFCLRALEPYLHFSRTVASSTAYTFCPGLAPPNVPIKTYESNDQITNVTRIRPKTHQEKSRFVSPPFKLNASESVTMLVSARCAACNSAVIHFNYS